MFFTTRTSGSVASVLTLLGLTLHVSAQSRGRRQERGQRRKTAPDASQGPDQQGPDRAGWVDAWSAPGAAATPSDGSAKAVDGDAKPEPAKAADKGVKIVEGDRAGRLKALQDA